MCRVLRSFANLLRRQGNYYYAELYLKAALEKLKIYNMRDGKPRVTAVILTPSPSTSSNTSVSISTRSQTSNSRVRRHRSSRSQEPWRKSDNSSNFNLNFNKSGGSGSWSVREGDPIREIEMEIELAHTGKGEVKAAEVLYSGQKKPPGKHEPLHGSVSRGGHTAKGRRGIVEDEEEEGSDEEEDDEEDDADIERDQELAGLLR